MLDFKSSAEIIIAHKVRISEIIRLKDVAFYLDPCTQFNLLYNSDFYCLFKLELPTIQ